MLIDSKAQMYEMLHAGVFGNRNPNWGECEAPFWGIRSRVVAGDARSKMYVPTDAVPPLRFPGDEVSPMIDRLPHGRVVAMVNVVEQPELVVYARIPPVPGLSWRQQMEGAPERRGTVARETLKQLLNPNSLEDLQFLLDTYPNHVVELSVLDRCWGTVKHRNAVIWEVRCTTGAYEYGWGKQ